MEFLNRNRSLVHIREDVIAEIVDAIGPTLSLKSLRQLLVEISQAENLENFSFDSYCERLKQLNLSEFNYSIVYC